MKKTAAIFLAVLIAQSSFFHPASAAIAPATDVYKELNLVFLHGMGGNTCTFQAISDQLYKLLPYFTEQFQQTSPNVNIRMNIFARCYPGYMDIDTWANNIADSINQYYGDKDNLILIGHSMGGKTALYAVGHNSGNITDRVAAVITINSPVKSLVDYYVPGGGPMPDYCRTFLLGDDEGICDSLAYYDCSPDGLKISQEKHWLAFVSAESTPLSTEFNRSGVDVWPRHLDDGVVPLSAQFAEGADVIYYGQHEHSDAGEVEELSKNLANYILRYIFGYPIDFSIPGRSGTIHHEADWLLGTDQWTDIVGGIETANGTITHKNTSIFKVGEWNDIIGGCNSGDQRSYSNVHLASVPLLTSISSASWVNSENLSDCRLKVTTKAAPLSTVEIEWNIYSAGILPEATPRSFFDVEITRGTQLANITAITWWKDDPLNPVLLIQSKAQSPFRWFEAAWHTYIKETRTVKLIDEIPADIVYYR